MSISLHSHHGFREVSSFDSGLGVRRGAAIMEEDAARLRLGLFGQMSATLKGRAVPLPKVRKTRALLAILALAGGRPVLRERIAGLLWSRREREQARASLRQCVHELQEFLGQCGLSKLRTGRQHMLLDLDHLWIDAAALASTNAGNPELVDLARSSFLEDLAGLDEAFDCWIACEEKRLRESAIAMAGLLLDRQSEPHAVIRAAHRLLDLAPGSENGWARLIQAHLDSGERSAAEDSFTRCARALAEHVSRAPSAETAALLHTPIIAAPPAAPAPGPTPRPHSHTRRPGLWLGVARLRAGEDALAGLLATDIAEAVAANLAAFRWLNIIPPASIDENGEAGFGAEADLMLDGVLQCRHSPGCAPDIRISLRLLDLRAGGEMVWSRRFERKVDGASFWQDDLACEIAAQVEPELLQHEARRAARRPVLDASPRELMLRAVPAIFRLVEPDYSEAGLLLARAAAQAPDDAAILGWWANWHLFLVGQSFAHDPHGACLRAGELAERAVGLDPGCARALSIAAHVRSFLLHKDINETISLHERALALNPSLPFAWAVSCLALSYAGRHEDALTHGERAHSLSPFDPHSFFFDAALLVPHFAMRQFDQVVMIGRRAMAINPAMIGPQKGLLSALGHLGRREEAAELLTKIRRQAPNLNVELAMLRSPLSRQEDRDLYESGLRLAGMD